MCSCLFVPLLSEQRFIQDPYATTFGGFSKVTNFFKVALRPPDSPHYSRTPQDPNLPQQPDEEPGFELITCVRAENGLFTAHTQSRKKDVDNKSVSVFREWSLAPDQT